MKYGLPLFLSCHWSRCLLGIGLLDFSEFQYLPQKFGRWTKNRIFLNLKKNLVINLNWVCSIMRVYIICCVPTQTLYLGKILFVRYKPKCSHPIRSQDLQINYFSWTNRWNSLIFGWHLSQRYSAESLWLTKCSSWFHFIILTGIGK